MASFRLRALYDHIPNFSDSDTDSTLSSGGSVASFPGCSTKKACHIAILLKGLQGDTLW